jgi:hypothetical protein
MPAVRITELKYLRFLLVVVKFFAAIHSCSGNEETYSSINGKTRRGPAGWLRSSTRRGRRACISAVCASQKNGREKKMFYLYLHNPAKVTIKPELHSNFS